MHDNKQPAYIVTEPALTALHTSQILTQQEHVTARRVWGEYAFNVEAYDEELYSKLFNEYVMSDEFKNRDFVTERLNQPDYISAHKKFYEQMMRDDRWFEDDDSVDPETLDKLCRES